MHDRSPEQLREFLAERLGRAKDDIPQASEWAGSGNTIGSLALRMGTLDLDQIGSVVELPTPREARFGDKAVELGHLTRRQVDQLVAIQELHRCVDLVGPLAMAGEITLGDLVALLAEFYAD